MSDDVEHFETYQFGNETLVKGTKIKFKNRREEYSFQRHVVNHKMGVEWIDCVDLLRHSWSSYYTDELSKVVKPRKRRKS